MELFRANVVDAKTMLENSSYPFATKILEAIKRNEQQAAQGAPMEGIPPELLAQLQSAQQSGADQTADAQALLAAAGQQPQGVPAEQPDTPHAQEQL